MEVFMTIVVVIVVVIIVCSVIDAVVESHNEKEVRQEFESTLDSGYNINIGGNTTRLYINKEGHSAILSRLKPSSTGENVILKDIDITKAYLCDGYVIYAINGSKVTINFIVKPFSLIVDENHEQLYHFSIDNDTITKNIINFSDIISIQICQDGEAVFSKSAVRTIGGAVVGGALLGGAGTVVGGLSGNTTQKNKITKIAVKLLLRSISDPNVEIILQNITKDYNECKEILAIANEIKDVVSVIIDAQDRKQKVNQTQVSNLGSIADELAKLATLKEKGILSEEEFNQQKAKILNM